ncbi:MAG TPA: CHAT domain-containing protein, partial [Longimicrobium sp.]|nr:CHAT domain-containing protein [Longimicrobium sp.]
NLTVREAVQGMVEGYAEVLGEDGTLSIRTLRIVEHYLDRALEILDVLRELEHSPTLGRTVKVHRDLIDEGGGEITPEFGCSLLLASLTDSGEGPGAPMLDHLLSSLPDDAARTRVRDKLAGLRKQCLEAEPRGRLHRLAMNLRLRDPEDGDEQQQNASRVAFWADGQDVHAAAITSTVTVTERAMGARLPLVDSAVERLIDPPEAQLPNLAATLSRMLVHADIRSVLSRSDSLVVEVDRGLSRVPWEMLPSSESAYEYQPLGVARPVARQLRTTYSPRLQDPEARQQPRVLVIGDPGDPHAGHDLPDARDEAVEVYEMAKASGLEAVLLVGAPEDGTGAGPLPGVAPAAYFDVVQHLLAGEFDVVHYCGHADFDPAAPGRAGWVFKGGLLTARELEGMERPPTLVVANACLTGQLWKGEGTASGSPLAGQGERRRAPAGTRPHGEVGILPTLADEFFKRGVRDYIGTAWGIPSAPAREFARTLYTCLLDGKVLGEAVRQARQSLFQARSQLGESASTWAAYQHYGDPTRRLEWVRAPVSGNGRATKKSG